MNSHSNSFKFRQSGHWIRLRTLILLRWWAIAGQLSALIISQRLYDLRFETGLVYMVIGVSVLSNLVAFFVYPENKRLRETEIMLFVLFDLLQLGLLLHLTGGLNNPFSILIVGPVVIAASALTTRSTVFLGVVTIAIVSLLTELHVPLQTQQGEILKMPDIFRFGNWVAIVIAVIFLGAYARRIVTEMLAMSHALEATQMALLREQKLTDLGGVIAAAAHELGTPLATIKLTSAELADELQDSPDLQEDALLIRQQADRCRDILRSMGRAGKDDLHLRKAPLMSVLEEAAEPHLDRGKSVHFKTDASAGDARNQPVILRHPEIIHGLRNLIQNAVDFARENVWIEGGWSDETITLRIMDDGHGYPPHLLGRIGEPFVRKRNMRDAIRPEYEGMGLGLFIAKTLLERSGADISFANGAGASKLRDQQTCAVGAVVELNWSRQEIDATSEANRPPVGQNQPITA